MTRFGLSFGLFLVCISTVFGQDVLLFNEDFEDAVQGFNLNSGGLSSNTGNNQWVINADYDGAPGYPATTPQNQTNGGTISFAPNSTYLHITDVPAGVGSASYNPTSASDRFVEMAGDVCTLGMDEVHFSFFYLCQGSPTAFGTLHYSIDGGPWTAFGEPAYSGQTNWQYEDLSDPSWSDVGSLRFGFRWQNDAGNGTGNLAFSIDDVTIVATYGVSDPITINVTAVSPNPVCEGEFATVSYELSAPLCDGNYQLQLSGPTGNFNAPLGQWVFNINYPQTTGSVTIQLPTNAPPGDCYRFRINRLSPLPAITGVQSFCFEIIDCPNTIETLQPVVTMDPFPVCIGSAIDVPFTSTGVFANNNSYVAQLSNPDGTFPNNPEIIGSSPDNATYDPELGQNPGSVSGLVPTVEPGCNYYIRVVSTNPIAEGTLWGPFCIQECDITTNGTVDLQFCVYGCEIEPEGSTQTVTIEVNSFNNDADYLPGNVFTTQLFSSQDFSQIGSDGILGSVELTESGDLEITVPCLEELEALGVPLGMNYMRIIATNSTTPDNLLGTLIRVTIGVFKPDPLVVQSYGVPGFQPQNVFCTGQTVLLQFQPYNFNDNSTFQWQSNGINGGAPFTSPSGANSNSLYVITGGPGELTFRVEETNFGCVSDWSEWHTITVLGQPSAAISGPPEMCANEVTEFEVPFYPNTYYGWETTAPQDFIAFQDTSNNVLNIAFNEPGTYQLNISVLNLCGSANAGFTVDVNPSPEAEAGDAALICLGESTVLSGDPIPGGSYSWNNGTQTVSNQLNATVSPTEDTFYFFEATSANGCTGVDSVLVSVEPPDPPVVIEDAMCPGGLNELTLTAPGPGQHLWSTGETNANIVVNDVGVYTLSTDIPNQNCPNLFEFNVLPLEPPLPVNLVDSICNGLANELVLSSPAVGTYQWSTGEDTPTIAVNTTGTFSVDVFSQGEACQERFEFTVVEFAPEPPTLLTDSVCEGGVSSIFLAPPIAGNVFAWSTGDDEAILTVNEPGTYAVEVYAEGVSCQRLFEWEVTPAVPPAPVLLADSVCPGGINRIRLEADAEGEYQWSTGQTLSYIDVNDTGLFVLTVVEPGAACPRTLQFTVTADTCYALPEIDVFIPNAITADGDELNEVFRVVFSDPEWVEDYHLLIANRWGEVVFESTDVNEGWLANFQDGAYYVDSQVYVYQLIFRSVFSAERRKLKGHIVVIR